MRRIRSASAICSEKAARGSFACRYVASSTPDDLSPAKGMFPELVQPGSKSPMDSNLKSFCGMKQTVSEELHPGRSSSILDLLKACASRRSIARGRLVHAEALRRRIESQPSFANRLLHMYVQCNGIDDAWSVFRRLLDPDIVSWGTMLMGFAIHGENRRALDLFEAMREKGVIPNTVVFLGILRASMNLGALALVQQSHHQIIQTSAARNLVLSSTLIDMYSKSGCLREARYLFDELQEEEKNAVAWGSIIAGYVQHGEGLLALALFEQMKQEGSKPDNFVLSCAFRACAKSKAYTAGSVVHIQAMHCDARLDIVVGNSLIDMYAKCGNVKRMSRAFDEMEARDAVSWGSVIAGHVQHDLCEAALELHMRMVRQGLTPDLHTHSCLIRACSIMGTLGEGRLLHGQIVRRGLGDGGSILGNALLDMYSKCGSFEDAKRLFSRLQRPDMVAWASMIAGAVQNGRSHEALELFTRMQGMEELTDKVTFLSVLKACGSVRAIQEGRWLHDRIVRRGLESDPIVGNALIDMYAKSESLGEARAVFDKLGRRAAASWGAMVSGLAQHGHIASALELLREMHDRGVEADRVTYLCIFNACSKMGRLKNQAGRLMHDQVIRNGLDANVAIGNAIVDMYAKRWSLAEAHRVFDLLPNRNVISWDTMMTGCIHHGQGRSALDLWRKMCCEDGINPIRVSFLCVLKACCIAEASKEGRLVHCQVVQSGLEPRISVINTLIDMYAKCGGLEDAENVLERSPNRDLVSWSSIISGHARFGSYQLAWRSFERLQEQGLKPNSEVFLGLLGACRQAGLVEEGQGCFALMTEKHNISPCIEHCSCIVDLLGNVGLLKEAVSFIGAMPCEPDGIIWTSLLASSALYASVGLGNYCFERLVESNLDDASVYALMAKIYADSGMQRDAEKVREMQKLVVALAGNGSASMEGMEEVDEAKLSCKNMEVNSLYQFIRGGGYAPREDWIDPHDDDEPYDQQTAHQLTGYRSSLRS